MWNNAEVKPLETFWENDKRPQVYTYLGGPKFGHLGPYYTHLWKYSSNEHIKQDCCESMLGWSRGYNKLTEGNYSKYFLQ